METVEIFGRLIGSGGFRVRWFTVQTRTGTQSFHGTFTQWIRLAVFANAYNKNLTYVVNEERHETFTTRTLVSWS